MLHKPKQTVCADATALGTRVTPFVAELRIEGRAQMTASLMGGEVIAGPVEAAEVPRPPLDTE
jgi:hypothetical protein